MAPIKRVLIVGGGTAGWLTAAYLAKALGVRTGRSVELSLVESSEIPILGVGEGTFPSIRGTLSLIGIDERRFLSATGATFKQGVKFANWVRPKGDAGTDHYFHPFSLPSSREGLDLLPYWLLGGAGPDVAFAEAVTLQKTAADAKRAPKRPGDGDYRGALNYAYHFDAGRFAALLAEEAMAQGVKRIIATVERAELDDTGAIAAILTREAGRLEADLFIDCTGFQAKLIGETLGSPVHGVDNSLFVDRALAFQIPYDRPDHPIASYTISTAQEAGWIWDIGLQERRGVGHVYSSRYMNEDRAESLLRAYAGPAGADLAVRQLKFRVGYREQQWVKNCVAVGLSGGFLEPLESSGIGLIETSTYLIAHLFPFGGEMAATAKLFNELMAARYQRIVDFIKLHYCLTRRTDTDFWRDNARPETLSEALSDKLRMWRRRPPHRLDFVTDLEMYLPSSWQYVLYGMEFQTDLAFGEALYPHLAAARREFAAIREVARHALGDLPDHRRLIDALLRSPVAPRAASV